MALKMWLAPTSYRECLVSRTRIWKESGYSYWTTKDRQATRLCATLLRRVIGKLPKDEPVRYEFTARRLKAR